MKSRNSYRTLTYFTESETKERNPVEVFILLDNYDDNLRLGMSLITPNGEHIEELSANRPYSIASVMNSRYMNIHSRCRETGLDFLKRYGLIKEDRKNGNLYGSRMITESEHDDLYLGVVLDIEKLISILNFMPHYGRNIAALDLADAITK